MAAHDPTQRKLNARIGGLHAAATGTHMQDMGKASAQARLRKHYELTDPELPEDERWKKAHLLYRAQMQRMAQKSRSQRQAKRPQPASAEVGS